MCVLRGVLSAHAANVGARAADQRIYLPVLTVPGSWSVVHPCGAQVSSWCVCFLWRATHTTWGSCSPACVLFFYQYACLCLAWYVCGSYAFSGLVAQVLLWTSLCLFHCRYCGQFGMGNVMRQSVDLVHCIPL